MAAILIFNFLCSFSCLKAVLATYPIIMKPLFWFKFENNTVPGVLC